jgi:hypothetical protein
MKTRVVTKVVKMAISTMMAKVGLAVQNLVVRADVCWHS